ncbi:hypothetical protein F0562_024569 [Nyssa sinensis]|uniref:Fe2OG dioxygenase domain-containing protein n=1 Tax=Nyssa sinensis TaxID=561372 RepID=A0A5J5BFB5_9ASTE|nr:hypothetical protein F0562_024569 [Nyssa sinensis]
MAGVSVLSAEELLSKRVQEMVLNGEEPPQLYICRDGDDTEDDSTLISPIPIIDMSLLSCSTRSTYEEELQKLKSALCSWGCFQAIGHGTPTSFLDKIRQVAREFFGQPMEEKKKISKTVVDFEGYGADPVPEEGQPLDWSDRLFLDVYPEDRRKYKLWPENPNSFREVLEEYTEKAENADRAHFQSHGERPDLVLGLKPHADGSGYTLIFQDEEGLQVQNNGKWFTVPKNPEAVLILMGDQMEIMTNGIFRSPVHRVLSNSERDRISVAMFYTPEAGKEIGPEDGLVGEERPRIFKKVKDYADTHWEYYQRGMRALHTATV